MALLQEPEFTYQATGGIDREGWLARFAAFKARAGRRTSPFAEVDRIDVAVPDTFAFRSVAATVDITDVTPDPVSSTMPAPSCPRMAGKMPSGSAPDNV